MKNLASDSVLGLCKWWNARHDGNVTCVAILGEIMPDTANELLAEIERAEDVHLFVDSLGGDALTARQVYDALKGKCSICSIVTAASAAVVIAMAGRQRFVRGTGKIMVHVSRSLAYATGRNLLTAAEVTLDMDAKMLELLVSATGCNRSTVIGWFDDEDHWFDAQQALALGFAHEIIATPAAQPATPPQSPATPTGTAGPTDDEEFFFRMVNAVGRITVNNRREFIQRFCQWAVSNNVQTHTEK